MEKEGRDYELEKRTDNQRIDIRAMRIAGLVDLEEVEIPPYVLAEYELREERNRN